MHSAAGSGEKQTRYQVPTVGRKNFAQLFYFFMCLRMVSALAPLAISNLAICREYQTSDFFRAFPFFKARYALRQLLYMPWVLILRASRRALFGL